MKEQPIRTQRIRQEYAPVVDSSTRGPERRHGHGSHARYVAGCRCNECRDGEALTTRRRRKED